jgi:hypothetical protein
MRARHRQGAFGIADVEFRQRIGRAVPSCGNPKANFTTVLRRPWAIGLRMTAASVIRLALHKTLSPTALRSGE